MRTNGHESLGSFNLANSIFESAGRAFEHVPRGVAHVIINFFEISLDKPPI
jgi:hypothetical protein